MSAALGQSRGVLVAWALFCGCHRPMPAVLEPDPNLRFDAATAEAVRLIPDAARGGPPLLPFSSPLPPFEAVDRATATYKGGTACAGCHAAETAVWASSPHARAFRPLIEAGASHRTDCVGCHAVGFLLPGGFVTSPTSADPDSLLNVQCESCHGPGSDHVGGGGRNPYGKLPYSAAACVACHTWETSPDFQFEAAWPRVAHGGVSAPGAGL